MKAYDACIPNLRNFTNKYVIDKKYFVRNRAIFVISFLANVF